MAAYDVIDRLLRGETVSVASPTVTVTDAALTDDDGHPDPRNVTMLVGGGNTALLRFAAERADIVGLSGLGRTLPDGHRHEVRWSPSQVAHQLDLVRAAADSAGRSPDVEALVQHVVVLDDPADRETELAAFARRLGDVDPVSITDTPYLLIGAVGQIVDQLQRQADELGITRFVVRAPTVPFLHPVRVALG